MTSTDPPSRGEIWLTALGTSRSGEPGKTRPAVVLTPTGLTGDSPRELVTVVPVSASAAPAALRPKIPRARGLDSDSVALPRAIRGVSRGRLLAKLGALNASELRELEAALSITLGLELL